MSDGYLKIVHTNPWKNLKKFTRARIALGRTGCSIPTKEFLDFQLCHSKARDAVHFPLDIEYIKKKFEDNFGKQVLQLKSTVSDRTEYLLRPDLGKKLSDESFDLLNKYPDKDFDMAFIIADGLSATSINENIIPFFREFIPLVENEKFLLAPITVVSQGRVAVSDEIGHLLKAKLSVIFIGERPGLNSSNSMGIYMTFDPKPGTTDEKRNCISNLRPEGLSYKAGASKLIYLLKEAMRRKISGIHLKDEQIANPQLRNP